MPLSLRQAQGDPSTGSGRPFDGAQGERKNSERGEPFDKLRASCGPELAEGPVEPRIGVFGGTFDPVHFGHLRSVQEVQERLRFDKLFIIPNRHPPHKRRRRPAGFEHRLAMLRLALGRSSVFQVSDMEGRRGGPSYSVETMQRIKDSHAGARLSLILGQDSFSEIATWKRYREVLDLCDVVVMKRPGSGGGASWIPLEIRRLYEYDGSKGVYRNDAERTLVLVEVTPLDVSASALRQSVKEGRSIRFLTPPSVERYIQEHRLYR